MVRIDLMKRSLLKLLSRILGLLLIAFTATSQASEPSGENCSLELPPPNAGYYAMLGVPFQVFPSAQDVGANYTGCQLLWSVEHAKPTLEMKIVFVEGKPIRGYAPEGESYPINCDQSGNQCEFAAPLPVPGYPKECLKVRTSPADSVGAYVDPDCQ